MIKLFLPALLSVSVSAVVVGGFVLYQSYQAVDLLKGASTPDSLMANSNGESGDKSDHKGEKKNEHKAEEAHGEESAAHGEDPHGESKSELAGVGDAIFTNSDSPIVTLNETFINVNSTSDTHYMRLKLELELFDEKQRLFVLRHKPGLQNTMIELSREQLFEQMNTFAGKLYFKEALAARFNTYLNQPAIREVHFADFYLQ